MATRQKIEITSDERAALNEYQEDTAKGENVPSPSLTMIAEPYICIEGPGAGAIEHGHPEGEDLIGLCYSKTTGVITTNYGPLSNWQLFADFEREKLRELGSRIHILDNGCFQVAPKERGYSLWSDELIGYSSYYTDSESTRLLKRAEFLRAVCEKEGVEWLPKEKPKGGCEKCGSHNTVLHFWTGNAVNYIGIECHDCGHYKREETDAKVYFSSKEVLEMRNLLGKLHKITDELIKSPMLSAH